MLHNAKSYCNIVEIIFERKSGPTRYSFGSGFFSWNKANSNKDFNSIVLDPDRKDVYSKPDGTASF